MAAFLVSPEVPLKQQPLPAAARQKLMRAAAEIADMRDEWFLLIRDTLRKFNDREEAHDRLLFRNMVFLGKIDRDEQPGASWVHQFDPRDSESVDRNCRLVCSCLDEIRGAGVAPWRELLPIGILHSKNMRDYFNAWEP